MAERLNLDLSESGGTIRIDRVLQDLFRGESETTAQADLSVGRLLLPNPSANLVSCNKRDDNSHLCHIRGFFAPVLEADEEVLF